MSSQREQEREREQKQGQTRRPRPPPPPSSSFAELECTAAPVHDPATSPFPGNRVHRAVELPASSVSPGAARHGHREGQAAATPGPWTRSGNGDAPSPGAGDGDGRGAANEARGRQANPWPYHGPAPGHDERGPTATMYAPVRRRGPLPQRSRDGTRGPASDDALSADAACDTSGMSWDQQTDVYSRWTTWSHADAHGASPGRDACAVPSRSYRPYRPPAAAATCASRASRGALAGAAPHHFYEPRCLGVDFVGAAAAVEAVGGPLTTADMMIDMTTDIMTDRMMDTTTDTTTDTTIDSAAVSGGVDMYAPLTPKPALPPSTPTPRPQPSTVVPDTTRGAQVPPAITKSSLNPACGVHLLDPSHSAAPSPLSPASSPAPPPSCHPYHEPSSPPPPFPRPTRPSPHLERDTRPRTPSGRGPPHSPPPAYSLPEHGRADSQPDPAVHRHHLPPYSAAVISSACPAKPGHAPDGRSSSSSSIDNTAPPGKPPPPLPPRRPHGPYDGFGAGPANATSYPPPPKTNYNRPRPPPVSAPASSALANAAGLLFGASSAKKWLDKTGQVLESRLEAVLQGPAPASAYGSGSGPRYGQAPPPSVPSRHHAGSSTEASGRGSSPGQSRTRRGP